MQIRAKSVDAKTALSSIVSVLSKTSPLCKTGVNCVVEAAKEGDESVVFKGVTPDTIFSYTVPAQVDEVGKFLINAMTLSNIKFSGPDVEITGEGTKIKIKSGRFKGELNTTQEIDEVVSTAKLIEGLVKPTKSFTIRTSALLQAIKKVSFTPSSQTILDVFLIATDGTLEVITYEDFRFIHYKTEIQDKSEFTVSFPLSLLINVLPKIKDETVTLAVDDKTLVIETESMKFIHPLKQTQGIDRAMTFIEGIKSEFPKATKCTFGSDDAKEAFDAAGSIYDPLLQKTSAPIVELIVDVEKSKIICKAESFQGKAQMSFNVNEIEETAEGKKIGLNRNYVLEFLSLYGKGAMRMYIWDKMVAFQGEHADVIYYVGACVA